MAPKSALPAEKPVDQAVIARIVAAARQHFFAHGIRTVTMDDLAQELGMSKKTLYACFPSKTALLEAVIHDKFQGMRAELDQIASADHEDFLTTVHQLLACLHRQIGEIQPPLIRDLRALSPDVFQRVETERRDVIQTYFGRFFAQGQRAGMIRTDISPELMVEIFLAAVQAIMNPPSFAALGITPQVGLSAIIKVVLEGVMLETGKPQ